MSVSMQIVEIIQFMSWLFRDEHKEGGKKSKKKIFFFYGTS